MIKSKGIKSTIQSLKMRLNEEKEIAKTKAIEQTIEALKEATPVRTGHARDGWRREGDSVVNDVDYISDLNNGTSRKAPPYFIENTVLAQPGLTANGVVVRHK